MGKKCSYCGEIKTINEFHLSYSSSDGHSYWCRQCKIILNRKEKEKKKEKSLKLFVPEQLEPQPFKSKDKRFYGVTYYDMILDFEKRKKDISKQYHHSQQHNLY